MAGEGVAGDVIGRETGAEPADQAGADAGVVANEVGDVPVFEPGQQGRGQAGAAGDGLEVAAAA